MISGDDKTFAVVEHYVSLRNKVNCPLDGRTATNPVLIADVWRTRPAEFKCTWKDRQLVFTFALSMPGEEVPRQYVRTLTLNADGVLVSEVRQIGTPHSLTREYRKK